MRHSPSLLAGSAALAAILSLSLPAAAQVQAPPSTELVYHHDSGAVANEGAATDVVISFPVVVQDASWMRLAFSVVELAGDPLAGTGSKLRLTSLLDGGVQELDAIHVAQWRQTSAYFNGDLVLVEVVAWPGTGPNRVVLEAVTAGEPHADKTQCGPTDDRVLSSDPRAGRLLPIGCTTWLIDDCSSCLLTAGHCTGNISVVEFNVPLSLSNGSIVNPPPEDQYAVDASSVQSNGGLGVGDDWGYLGVFPNSNTGLTPFEAQGQRFTLAAPPPFDPSEDIRITGYGVDSTPSENNQVQQTHFGPWVTSSGSTLQYQADTEGGNSGSPVIHEATGVAIGIHTHGGCSTSGSGQNSGTASTHPGLQAALASPRGICEGGLTPASALPDVLTPGVASAVTVQAPGTVVAGSVRLHTRFGGGPFVAAPMVDLGGGLFQGTLLAGACSDQPEYYFSMLSSVCGVLTTPASGPAAPYTALVGTELVVFADDFETDQGWSANNLGATTGDWERGVPVNDPGWAYDPAGDSDGSGQCYLTQNQLGNTDIDDGTVELVSPVLDLSQSGLVLSYDYFLNLTDASGTDRLLVEASTSGPGGPFTEVARHDTSGGLSWRSHTLSNADFAAAGLVPSATTVLRFQANDGDPQSINESGLDAFRVANVVCGSVGASYCTSNGAAISATGSASLAANDLVLQATGMPANKNGMFIYSRSQQAVSFGLGTLCVGPTKIFRLQPLLKTSAAGSLTNAVDYGALNPNGQPVAGETLFFQAWFRSNGSSDLSDGLAIDFAP